MKDNISNVSVRTIPATGAAPLGGRASAGTVVTIVGFHIYTGSAPNTLRPRQNGRHFPDDIFNCIFLNENIRISLAISLKFVPRRLIKNIPALVQIWLGDIQATSHYLKQWWLVYWSHICVTRPKLIKRLLFEIYHCEQTIQTFLFDTKVKIPWITYMTL